MSGWGVGVGSFLRPLVFVVVMSFICNWIRVMRLWEETVDLVNAMMEKRRSQRANKDAASHIKTHYT